MQARRWCSPYIQTVISLSFISSIRNDDFIHFEHIDYGMDFVGLAVHVVVVYRPSPSKVNTRWSSAFLDDEIACFLIRNTTIHKDIRFVVDFHLHVKDDHHVAYSSIYTNQHILYVVIIKNTSNRVSDNDVIDPGFCDHVGRLMGDYSTVSFIANIAKPTPSTKTAFFRKEGASHVKSFKLDIAASALLCQSGDSVEYNNNNNSNNNNNNNNNGRNGSYFTWLSYLK